MTPDHLWPPERIARLAKHVGGDYQLAIKAHLHPSGIWKLRKGLFKKHHALTLKSLARVARATRFERPRGEK